jgi:hypothetical protein
VFYVLGWLWDFRRVGLGIDHANVESIATPRWGKESDKPAPPPQDFVRIRITNQAGKYATLSPKEDLLVAPKAQASEFPVNEAPRRQKELERPGFTTKVESV